MMTAVFCFNNKKKNSTYQVTPGEDALICNISLKQPCNINNPVFTIKYNDVFGFNYCIWEGQYFYVDGALSIANGVWEVSCSIDVLATYRAEILNYTAFVSYADKHVNNWLVDPRLPISAQTRTDARFTSMSDVIIPDTTNNILTVISNDGCQTWVVADNQLRVLTNSLQTIVAEYMLESGADVADALQRTSILSNSFGNAPQCIKSCVKVPFSALGGFGDNDWITLGNFETPARGVKLNTAPLTGTKSVTIPWISSGWLRKNPYSQVYLYLPFVGVVPLSSDNLTHVTSIQIKYSYTVTDGNITYEVSCGSNSDDTYEMLGTYGGSCVIQVPIGVLAPQTLGSGGSLIQGAANTVASAIGSIPIVGSALTERLGAFSSEVSSGTLFSNPTSIGGVGGGAAAGVETDIVCYVVSHTISDNLTGILGGPVMKKYELSNMLGGYVQCSGASVNVAAHASEIDLINAYLNSGIFLE